MPFSLDEYKKRNNRLVLEELLKTLPIPLGKITPDERERLEGHETRVMTALGAILSGQENAELGLDYAELDIDLPALNITDREGVLLELALALHDIGKRCGDDVPHPESGYKLLEQHQEELKIAIGKHCQQPGANGGELKPEEAVDLILWIVRHHDVVGNIYTGERRVRYLNSVLGDVRYPQAHRLLFVVAVADFVGASPKRLRKRRVSFWWEWLNKDKTQRDAFSDLEQRMEQWTWGGNRGIALGSPAHFYEKERLEPLLKGRTREVFKDCIDYIIYGLYLLQDLEAFHKAILLNRVADEYDRAFANGTDVALTFEPPYKGRDPAWLAYLYDAYVDAIENGTIPIEPEIVDKKITVRLPQAMKPQEIKGILSHNRWLGEEVTAYLPHLAADAPCRGTLQVPKGWQVSRGEILNLKTNDGLERVIAIRSCDADGTASFLCLPDCK